MSTDYDRLRELLETHSPAPWAAIGKYDDGKPRPDTSRLMRGADGEYLGIMHQPDAELAALAPELARELLRQRDGVEVIRDRCANLARSARAAGMHTLANEMYATVKALAELLEGDTE